MRKILITAAAVGMLATGAVGTAHANNSVTNPENLAEHPALYGLCTAYFANGGNGNSHNAPPFAALAEAADDDDPNTENDVERFCESVRPSNGQGQGSGNSNAPSPTDPRGNNRG